MKYMHREAKLARLPFPVCEDEKALQSYTTRARHHTITVPKEQSAILAHPATLSFTVIFNPPAQLS